MHSLMALSDPGRGGNWIQNIWIQLDSNIVNILHLTIYIKNTNTYAKKNKK